MSDDLERQLQEAFHRGSLPPAPPSLLDGLQRVPDLPIRARPRTLGRTGFGLLAAAVIIAVAGSIAFLGGSPPPAPSPNPTSSTPAMSSGLQIELQLLPAAGVKPGPSDLDRTLTILKARLDATGIVGWGMETTGEDRLTVTLPGVAVPDAAPFVRLLSQVGNVAFVPIGTTPASAGDTIDPATFPPLLTGAQIASATVGNDQNGRPAIDLVLTADGTKTFGDYTAANIGNYLAITFDGTVVSAPVIQNSITSGNVQIAGGGLSGLDAQEEATMVAILDNGPLPFPIQVTSTRTIERPSPSPSSS
jgi:preprotein translocase subunit SecD